MKIKKYFFGLIALFHKVYENINYYRVIHGMKTAAACLIGLAIEKYYAWPMGQWVPITIMVVMSAQTHFGGALRKAYMRFLGTAGGVIIVVAALSLFGNDTVVAFCTIFLASMFFTYVASSRGDISYAGTLGGVTVILILSGQQISIEAAIQRGSNIVIGIIIALLVSRFIFPIHARDRFRYHVARTLSNLGTLYSAAIKPQEPQTPEHNIDTELTSTISADIANQPQLIYEAVAGSMLFSSKKDVFIEILNSEHYLNRLINLIYLSLRETKSLTIIKKQLAAVQDLHLVVENSLNYLSSCFESNKQPKKMVNLDAALAEIAQVVENLPKNENAHQLIAEHSFLFFMELILKELENLRKLIVKVNSKYRDNMV